MKAISIHCLICKLLVCGAWMWMSTLVSSQRATISFEHFTSNEGLSAPVNQITQDQYGFIWLGTTDGLNRFDGRNFVVYRNVPGDTTSLPNNIINALCVDRIGHVWIATNGGLCYYDFEDDAFHQVEFADTVEKLDRHRVHAVAADPFGNIWFATRTHLHRWHDHEAVISIPVPGDESLQLRYLYADDHKQVWLGMNTGIIRYDVNTQHFTILPITSPFTIEKNLTVTVSPIIPYKGDTLLIGSWYGGLQKIFPTGNSIGAIPYTDQAESDPRKHIIRGVSPGANGIYWVGSYGNGLSVFDSRTSAFTAHYHHDPSNERSLSDDYINSVFTDKSGIVWIGTEIGLDKFDPFTQQFQSISIPTFSGEFSVYRMPNTIVEDPNHQGHLWFSVSGAGIYEYNPATDAFSVHRADPKDPHGLPENTVYTLYRDHSGRQWVGMKSGICLASPDLRRYEPLTIFGHEPTPSIHIILESADGSFWFGSFSNGVYHYDERTKKLDHYAHDDAVSNTLPDNRVFCMIADHLGYIWIGTQNRGLCRLDPKTGQFTFFVHDKSSNQAIPDNGIYDLYEDPAHKLWIATENGLAVMDLGDFSMTNFSTQDGLCNNDVFSITPDGQGNLWLATNNGMSRFNPSN
ncbi:MAG TPA: two-component regulator propeller domain-containing protein, partial [Saprospiraceae bacterium]|nr:two-component regulator propeller domain-containing protein [Saprospiraceae bacterium]